jgi:hypothetical protein
VPEELDGEESHPVHQAAGRPVRHLAQERGSI